MEERIIFAMFVIVIAAALQITAWIMHYNGQVFAFTSLIIGAVAGSILGFALNVKTKK